MASCLHIDTTACTCCTPEYLLTDVGHNVFVSRYRYHHAAARCRYNTTTGKGAGLLQGRLLLDVHGRAACYEEASNYQGTP